MFKKFLKDKKGESLVETLAAVLIFTMASIGLYSMILSAAHSNGEVKLKDRENQEQLAIAESAKADTAREGEVVVTIGPAENSHSFSVRVDVFGDTSGNQLYSYFEH